jgi:phosphoadenosine phosphosulfate reductase
MSMGVVRLGKMALRWCNSCNVPVLESKECGSCHEETYEVRLTPPGDIRPAFESDLKLIREVIDSAFGLGCGKKIIPEDKIVILNKAPSLDRMDEFIVDGKVQGALRYDLGEGYKVILRLHAAQLLENEVSKNWIVVDPGAIGPISKGANALSVGILEVDSEIQKGDEVIILSPEKKAIAIGKAMKNSESLQKGRGVGVKSRWYKRDENYKPLPSGQTMEDVFLANSWFFEKKIPRAIEFIKKTVGEKKNIAVSFSGGKDSLATLLLALDSDLKPKILFVDTGLEFQETIDHVKEIADHFDLELLTESAEGVFWRDVPKFGPPGKDFRWCCKTCKLGPTVRLINKHFPEGVISLIGQRAYESEQRAKKGRTWRNPWVPGQLGISPIQNWTALHIWLYIFKKEAPYNVWYERGLERIGCWLCPSADIADLSLVKSYYPEYEKWERFLKSQSDKMDHPKEWLEMGLWRWKKLPEGLINLMEEKDVVLQTKKKVMEIDDDVSLKFYSAEGYRPCDGGVSIEGMFTRSLDMKRVTNMMHILGEVTYDDKTDSLSLEDVDIFGEGGVVVKGRDEKKAKKLMKKVKETIIRAHLCVGCGICTGRCEQDALILDDHVILDEEKCISCRECLGPCPVIGYGDSEFEF